MRYNKELLQRAPRRLSGSYKLIPDLGQEAPYIVRIDIYRDNIHGDNIPSIGVTFADAEGKEERQYFEAEGIARFLNDYYIPQWMVNRITEAGVNARDNDGYTALHRAIIGGNVNNVKALIDKGADVDARDRDGDTPLHIAARNGRKEIIALLIPKVANVNALGEYGYTPLHLAAMYGYQDIVESLVSEGADVHAENNYGHIPLHLSAKYGRKDLVVFFIEQKGVNANAKSYFNETPLGFAKQRGHADIISLLEEAVQKQLNKPSEAIEKPNTDFTGLIDPQQAKNASQQVAPPTSAVLRR